MSGYDPPNPTQCDRCVLNLFRSHLMQEEKSELECSQIQQLLAQFRAALNQGGIISLSRTGNVRFMTQRAEQILSQYFPSYSSSTSLPLHLKKWFKFQISQLKISSDDPCLCSTLHIEQDEKDLNIRFIPEQMQGHYLLLLEEKRQSIFSIADLELLGLTKREAEVLFWVSKDKSNSEIATVLGCSGGTVGKHLEHIYSKLRTHTRAGAVIVALERLGMLRQ
ncbi:MAG: LuxR family transcriptional regulator [Microcystis wesenbergii Mw_QC_S_20081001_S30D]|uniref:LuxR family transcriptional regulator n=1 Tax=Microcystis wesenbergii Mw_QC_S_20081001_S30D TaxID=2486245 RepID=A0A552JIS4_9CHRO|nr:MAG: LuxR family transcriptional regulator [Microcystis wesenbergii Mw_QC_S_20081001_S30D]TRV01006.1 MAG: LuxR family transcriptional regulator [Microcystis wesenbergii Mw_QC_S_20081001_S30]TRV04272.1 MAG: LuxR family transcriptional regulator [Microcystis wesenbergii Mw_QC_B_20070930_S4D]TRV08206.1 MAG: LuxR family transcriptional regulator [Microcystis wesenbergii Mw_QC_B_20070930_S4]